MTALLQTTGKLYYMHLYRSQCLWIQLYSRPSLVGTRLSAEASVHIRWTESFGVLSAFMALAAKVRALSRCPLGVLQEKVHRFFIEHKSTAKF